MPHEKPQKVKALIVEDQPLFRKGLVSLIESKPGYSIAGQAAALVDALNIAKKEKPSLAIIEINLASESGMDLIPRLKNIDPDIAILVLSMCDERYYSERVLHLGARGYIMKTETPQKVLDAIQTVMSGKVYLSDAERERILQAMPGENLRGEKDWAASLRKLSNRELQIFSCLGKGQGNLEIAAKYKISTKTIDTHKEHIKLKLHCNSAHELRQLAIEWAGHQDT